MNDSLVWKRPPISPHMELCKMHRGCIRERESMRAGAREQVGVRQLGVCAALVTEVNVQEGRGQRAALGCRQPVAGRQLGH